MWNLYDNLYIGIPSGIRIEKCIIGKDWTAVLANNNIGVARTPELPGDPEGFAASFSGAYLRDTANHMKWDNPVLAGVGVAAMNAWYNTAERAEALGGGPGSIASGQIGGRTAFVGDYAGENVFPLPIGPVFDATGYESLSKFDKVVIAGETLISRALPGLLDIVGENGNVLLEGYSLPCSALFFSFGLPVKEINGFYVQQNDGIKAYTVDDVDRLASGAIPFAVRAAQVEKIREKATL